MEQVVMTYKRGQVLSPDDQRALRKIVASVPETKGAASRRHVIAERWGISHQTLFKAERGGKVDSYIYERLLEKIEAERPPSVPLHRDGPSIGFREYLDLSLPHASEKAKDALELMYESIRQS